MRDVMVTLSLYPDCAMALSDDDRAAFAQAFHVGQSPARVLVGRYATHIHAEGAEVVVSESGTAEIRGTADQMPSLLSAVLVSARSVAASYSQAFADVDYEYSDDAFRQVADLCTHSGIKYIEGWKELVVE